MKINTYLVFSGQCKEAFELYARVLGGTIQSMVTHGETPAAAFVPADWGNTIMHAVLTVGDAVLMGSDAPPDRFQAPQGFSVALHVSTPAEADRIFQALSENGDVRMPIQETFWSARFGMVTDRFGIPWMVNCVLEPAAAA